MGEKSDSTHGRCGRPWSEHRSRMMNGFDVPVCDDEWTLGRVRPEDGVVTDTIPTEVLRCPVHDMPDCSPLLNGCSIPDRLAEAYRAGLASEAFPDHLLDVEHWRTLLRDAFPDEGGRADIVETLANTIVNRLGAVREGDT